MPSSLVRRSLKNLRPWDLCKEDLSSVKEDQEKKHLKKKTQKIISENLTLEGTAGSKLLAQAGPPQPVAQDHVQTAFEYVKEWTVTSQCSVTFTVKWMVCSDVQKGYLLIQFVPIASCPITGYHWEDPASAFSAPSLQVFKYTHWGDPAELSFL